MFFVSLLPQSTVCSNYFERLKNVSLEIKQTDNPQKILERKIPDIICRRYCCPTVIVTTRENNFARSKFHTSLKPDRGVFELYTRL